MHFSHVLCSHHLIHFYYIFSHLCLCYANTGGVVSFISRSSHHPDQIMGLRSRVLNSKRTDLSKGIRAKIEADALRIKISSKIGGPCEPKAGTLVKTYVGHTRFATSSLASFDGTHPHRKCQKLLFGDILYSDMFSLNSIFILPLEWTPPRLWRCYDLSRKKEGMATSGSTQTLIENFITHNGLSKELFLLDSCSPRYT